MAARTRSRRRGRTGTGPAGSPGDTSGGRGGGGGATASADLKCTVAEIAIRVPAGGPPDGRQHKQTRPPFGRSSGVRTAAGTPAVVTAPTVSRWASAAAGIVRPRRRRCPREAGASQASDCRGARRRSRDVSLYVDTSALLERDIEEPDSVAAEQYLLADLCWVTTRHTRVEVRRNLSSPLNGTALSSGGHHSLPRRLG